MLRTRTHSSRTLLVVAVAALLLAATASTAAVASRADGAVNQNDAGQGWGSGNGNGNGNGRDIADHALLQTPYHWSEGYDENEPELMRDAFTQDARFVYASPAFTEPLVFDGIDAVMKLFTDSLASQNDQRRHVDTNSQIHPVDRRTVKVTTYLTLLV